MTSFEYTPTGDTPAAEQIGTPTKAPGDDESLALGGDGTSGVQVDRNADASAEYTPTDSGVSGEVGLGADGSGRAEVSTAETSDDGAAVSGAQDLLPKLQVERMGGFTEEATAGSGASADEARSRVPDMKVARMGDPDEGTSETAGADGLTDWQREALTKLAESARDYDPWMPKVADAEGDEHIDDDHTVAEDDNSVDATPPFSATYSRDGEEERDRIARDDMYTDNPRFTDSEMQARHGRDEAQQRELRGAYEAAKTRYHAARIGSDGYWDRPTHEERRAIDKELQLARDQFDAAGDRLFRGVESVYDTAFNDGGGRYINGEPVSQRQA